MDVVRQEILKYRQEVLDQDKKLDSILALLDPNVSEMHPSEQKPARVTKKPYVMKLLRLS